jgi:hypothetical protein
MAKDPLERALFWAKRYVSQVVSIEAKGTSSSLPRLPAMMCMHHSSFAFLT